MTLPGRGATILCLALAVLLARDAARAYAGPLPLRDPAARADIPSLLDRHGTLLLVGFGTAAILSRRFEDEEPLRRALDGLPIDGAIDLADVYGAGATLGLTAVGLHVMGRGLGDARMAQSGEELTRSLLASWAVTWSLKLLVDERRPNGGPHSFPSGHTATAFAAAPVLHRYLGGRSAGAAPYVIAGLTGLARLEDRRHHVADVLIGAAVGLAASRTLAASGSIGLVPLRRGVGVGWTVEF